MTGTLPDAPLVRRVVDILASAERPLKAREIAERVGSNDDPGGLRRQVNRLLYGRLAALVSKDEQNCWKLVHTPSSGEGEWRQDSDLTLGDSKAVTESSQETPGIHPDVLRRVQATLDLWKRELIEFGRRNKLLYFNSSRRTRLRLSTPDAVSLYEGLVLRDKSFSFAVPVYGTIDEAELEEDTDSDREVAEQQGDIAVDYDSSSATDVRSLQRKLFRLRSDARTTLNEQGINTLHVSLGVLKWREADTAQSWVESPILLVPASLAREQNGPYRLSGFEGDVVVNPALAYRLRHDFEFTIPSFDPFDGFGERADVPGYLAELSSVVRDRGWDVSDAAWLTHFSFEKLVMYEDLSQPGTAAELATHGVLGAICDVRDPNTPEVSLETLDEDFELPGTFPVVDADSSQLSVMARVKGGQSLVVQGPPGTGKSQTIVNLIAQAIRDGKSVLFVSEKRAALEVVHRRLRDADLSDLCLELHSHRANKREVVRDLYLGMQGTLETTKAPDSLRFEQRRAARRRLDAYAKAVHMRQGRSGRSAFEIHGVLASLESTPMIQGNLPVDRYLDLDVEREAAFLAALNGVVVTRLWDTAEQHPWREAVLGQPSFVVRQTIGPTIEQIRSSLAQILAVGDQYRRRVGGSFGPDSLATASLTAAELESLQSMPDEVSSSWLSCNDSVFAEILALLTEARARAEAARARMHELQAGNGGVLEGDRQLVSSLGPRYGTEYRSILSRLSGRYRRDRKLIESRLGRRAPYREAVALLGSAQRLHEAQIWLEDRGDELFKAGEQPWPASEIGERNLLDALNWSREHRQLLRGGRMSVAAADRVVTGATAIRDWAKQAGIQVASSGQTGLQAVAEIGALFPNGIDGEPLEEVDLPSLKLRADHWADAQDKIDEWDEYERAVSGCTEIGLDSLLTEARRRQVTNDELIPVLRKLIATNWLVAAHRETPGLGAFSAKSHESVIEEFQRLDRELMTEARQSARHGAGLRQAVVRQAARAQSINARQLDATTRTARDEYKLVSKEYGKKRMHIPLRRLLPKIPTILPAVKPCLLMSPLSVANYLPRDQFTFDLVIFDEASQVLPADAIGAILRGRQLVVLGDSKQLPPTRFFQRHLNDGDFDEADEAADAVAFDSILEISAAALPETSLRWHYRSRDERLIAFSNRRFYSERPLITFPSPDSMGDTGVRFVHVARGLYDRGGSKTNVEEARQVVDLVVEHLERYGWDRSLGVVALSISQRDAIELELRRRLLDRPDLEPFLAETGSEPLFIKNLETVQGDERDEVILSVGYGPSEPGGTPSLAFGPLNVSGGERRLNVAITRAKYAMTLVTSMRPEQLDRVAELTSTGPKVLAEYMGYAARGGRFESEGEIDPTRLPQSPFEEAVLEALQSKGYVVDPQVGASGFRIDLGIRHPDIDTRYILGLECDGATYHSAASARDRDRLRQEMLESQGWKIHRIWSTDWIQHPDVTLQSLVRRIEQLRTLEEVGVLARPRLRAVPPPTEEPEPVASAEKQEAPESSLPLPFVEEQEEALIFEHSRLERQLATMHDSYQESRAQPDKGFTSSQVEQALESRLTHVRDALSRIRANSYGACQRCGVAIEQERLEVVPWTPFCRDCSQTLR